MELHSFVTGHDFSRAASAVKKRWALAPEGCTPNHFERIGSAMLNKKDRDFIISMSMCCSIYLIFLLITTRDVTKLPKSLAILFVEWAVLGVLSWYLRRWRFLRLTAVSILLCLFGSSAIFSVIKGKYWGILVGLAAFIWMTYELKGEISKQKSLGKTQLSNDSTE